MWRSGFVLLAIIIAAEGFNTTAVTQCTRNSAFPMPLNVYVEGCEQPPCQLPQLQDAVVRVVFRADRNLNNMRTLAQAFFPNSIIAIPYGLGANAVTCNFIDNSYCPILEGEVVMYTLRMYIESFFALNTQVNIEFRVQDGEGLPVFCFRTLIRIAAPVDGNGKTDGNGKIDGNTGGNAKSDANGNAVALDQE